MTETYIDLEQEAMDLYDYVFHYNHYRRKWAKVKRGSEKDYFNGNFEDVEFIDKVSGIIGEEMTVDREAFADMTSIYFAVIELASKEHNDMKLGASIREIAHEYIDKTN